MVSVQFVGSGDAFGSGGRAQACISVRAETAHVLLDCGASSLPAMQRLGVEPGRVDAVIVTHLHGDHFGGLPFLVLHGQFNRRERPLLVAGPPGLGERVLAAMEVLFPGSARAPRKFELRFVELAERVITPIGVASVTGHVVPHPSGAPAYALRVELDGKVIGYTGDGEWSEALVDVARDADLFVCEAYSLEKVIKHHLSYATLRQHRARLDCRRLILTHLGPEMLAHRSDVDDDIADDGLVLTL